MKGPANEDFKSYYGTADEIESLVQRFESCALNPAEMTHRAHLAVSAWYLSRFSISDATGRIRESLVRFIEHNGLKGYNETITMFWIKLVMNSLENLERGRAIEDLISDLIARFGNSRIIFDYYSKGRLLSEEAKAGWVEPDLKPLGF
jgi:hypothetical protein